MTVDPKEFAAAAMTELGLDPSRMKMYLVLCAEQARVLLESGSTLEDLRAVVDWCARLAKAGDKSPQLTNLVFLWRHDVFPVLLRATIEDFRAEEMSAEAFSAMMNRMGA